MFWLLSATACGHYNCAPINSPVVNCRFQLTQVDRVMVVKRFCVCTVECCLLCFSSDCVIGISINKRNNYNSGIMTVDGSVDFHKAISYKPSWLIAASHVICFMWYYFAAAYSLHEQLWSAGWWASLWMDVCWTLYWHICKHTIF